MQIGWILAVAASATLVIDHGAGARQVAAPPSTGLILGRVVDATSGAGIPGVLVNIGGAIPQAANPVATQPVVLTDTEGRFVFRGLAKGTYALNATIGGTGFSPSGFLVSGMGPQIGAYLNGGYGQLRPNGPTSSIDLGDGERIADAVIRLWKSAAIEGTVLDEAGEPLVGAAIAAVRRSSDGRLLSGPTTKTDDRGRYRLGTLAPGEYVVVVPQTQVLMPASTVDTALAGTTSVLPGAASSFGSPAAWSASSLREGATLVSTGVPPSASNTLAPVSRASRSYVYQTTFHSTATAASRANAVRLTAGETRAGVDVRLQPVAAVEVSGVVQDSAGGAAHFPVRLVPADAGDGASVLEVATTVTDGRGAFRFPLVPAGMYRLTAVKGVSAGGARAGAPPPPPPRTVAEQPGAWANQHVVVGDQHIMGLVLTLQPGAQITGRIEFVGAAERPAVNRLRELSVRALPLDLTSRTAAFGPFVGGAAGADGNFVLNGVPAGRYVISVQRPFVQSLPGGWTLSSITIGGRDITDRAVAVSGSDISDVVVRFSDQPHVLTGTVRDAGGAPDATASVFVFPADRSTWADARAAEASSTGNASSSWILRTARVSRTGAFIVPNLIPGDYFVVAASDAAAGDWPDPRFFARLASVASTVQIAAGVNPAVALRTVDLR